MKWKGQIGRVLQMPNEMDYFSEPDKGHNVKEQIKKRLLDVLFLALAMAVGLGSFFIYANVRAHQQLDAAFIELIKASQQQGEQVAPAAEELAKPGG